MPSNPLQSWIEILNSQTHSFFGASSLKICTVSVLLDAHKNRESWLKANEKMVTHLKVKGKMKFSRNIHSDSIFHNDWKKKNDIFLPVPFYSPSKFIELLAVWN